MKKFFYILLSFLAITELHACPQSILQKLHDVLKLEITSISWLDINCISESTDAMFVIRYYPCGSNSEIQLNTVLPKALAKIAPNCSLLSPGFHVGTEGYCTLENIIMRCSA